MEEHFPFFVGDGIIYTESMRIFTMAMSVY